MGEIYCSPAAVNSTGMPAEIGASGSASASAGDLVLEARSVPDQFGLFFHGADRAQIPFGNGFLCATGDIVRGAPVHALDGSASYAYDNSDAKHSVLAFVGATRHFQFWFRDPLAGGARFNTSDAIPIVILP